MQTLLEKDKGRNISLSHFEASITLINITRKLQTILYGNNAKILTTTTTKTTEQRKNPQTFQFQN